MKRVILLGIVVFLCSPFVSYAASIGSAETQGKGKFSIGLDQEFGFDRDIKDKTFEAEGAYVGTVDIILDGTPIKNVNIAGTKGEEEYKSELDRMSRSMIKLSYGVSDNLDVFARLGEAHLKWKGKGEAPDSGTFSDPSGNSGTYDGVEEYTNTMKGKSAFAWGLGLNGIYPLENDWFLGVQAQYLRHKNSLKWSEEGKAAGTYVVTAGPGAGKTGTYETVGWSDEGKAKVTVQEWQVAPYIARKLGSLVPYFGVKYSDQRIEYKGEGEKIKFKADDNFGVFVGIDYKLGDNWKLNLEGRFVDETAMSFGATYRF